MTRTVDDVLRDINNIGGNSVIWAERDMVALRAEILALRAERDALRAAVRDAELQIFVHSRSDWNSRHAAVIARAREVGK